MFQSTSQQSNFTPIPKYKLTELVAFADAAYTTDTKTCHSVSGYVIVYAGAAISCKAKLQPTVAMSSTEAEFISAIYTAKAVKHLHSILNDLGLLSPKATIIYEDNMQQSI